MVVDDDRGLLATGCPTPRCRDRMTWAAILAIGGRIGEQEMRRRLELAAKDEIAFWMRLEESAGATSK
jgi:hypothetical protein